MLSSAMWNVLGCPCPVTKLLPGHSDQSASGASNLAQCNLASTSHQSYPSVNEIFFNIPQYKVGKLVATPFWLCALALRCYQPRDLDFFFYYEYPHPLHLAEQTLERHLAEQTLETYKVCVPVPTSQSIPELRYDNAGNAYVRDHLGHWQPHPGIAQAVTRVPRSEDCQAYGQHAAAPLMYGLTTPANFSQPHLSPPPSPSGSRLVLSSAYQDPVHIPLPDSPDRDLCDPLMIAESRGCYKNIGSCQGILFIFLFTRLTLYLLRHFTSNAQLALERCACFTVTVVSSL
ncbi:hypothetical protein F4604DRAFT_1939147 [Suillus subluteus]|nr:hypothetical protein F4604DRAFT_1939147 [Suillus subluteus]